MLICWASTLIPDFHIQNKLVLCRRCYYFLRKVYSVRDTVDRKSLIELVRVISRLDYCNSLYYGLSANSIQKLQRIMNSACLIFRLSPGSPTANYIKQLHWLPMKQRVLYKILLFGHRLVHHPWKALVFRIDKVTGCQYAYNLKVPNVDCIFFSVLLSLLDGISCLLK